MTFLADKPCTRCGWKFKGFHICIENPSTTVEAMKPKRGGAKTQDQFDAMNEGRALRWESYREETQSRDDKIVKLYKNGGVGYIDIARKMNLSKSTVQKVLKRAEAEGLVKLRPRGTTLAKGAK